MAGWEPPKCGADCHRTYNSNRKSSVEKWAGGNPIMTGWESDHDRVGTSKHKKRWAGGNPIMAGWESDYGWVGTSKMRDGLSQNV